MIKNPNKHEKSFKFYMVYRAYYIQYNILNKKA